MTNSPPPVCVSDLHFLLLIMSVPEMSQPTNLASLVFPKTFVNYPAHTVLLQTPQFKMTMEKILTTHPCDHCVKMRREMTDFSIIFTFGSLWAKWKRQQTKTGWCTGDIYIYKKRQCRLKTQWCVWHSDTKHRHTGTCSVGVYLLFFRQLHTEVIISSCCILVLSAHQPNNGHTTTSMKRLCSNAWAACLYHSQGFCLVFAQMGLCLCDCVCEPVFFFFFFL